MKLITLIALCLIFSVGQAQTKLIAFKSHAGSMHLFNKVLKDNSMDISLHNLGMAPRPRIKLASLDSVIYLTDSTSIMVTSNYCSYDSSLTYSEFWKPGKDTVLDHPLFSEKHALDSIKTNLKTAYHFANDIDSVVFVGYDNKEDAEEDDSQQEEVVPILAPNAPPSSSPPISVFTLLSIGAMISLLIGFVVWKRTVKSILSSSLK